jgi:hypothetical protein
MARTTALVALAVLITGCSQFPREGPFAKPKRDIPPPYGSVPPPPSKPVGGLSPLGMSAADPASPLSPEDHALIPPKLGPLVQAGGVPKAPAQVPIAQPVKTAALVPDPAEKNLADLKSLVARANQSWGAVTTVEAQLTRREINPQKQLNSEVLLIQFRREPMSVYTRNLGESGKGREVVYNPGAFGDKLHVKLGEGDHKLMKAGFLAPPVSPDDPRVKEKARYSIRDAGFGRPIGGLAAAVKKVETGQLPRESVTFNGEVQRDEYPYPLVGVTVRLAPGDDPLFPSGGTRQYCFDMKSGSTGYGLPVLVMAYDAAGKEAEYYLYEKVKNPANLTDTSFNPARLGK